MEPRRIVRLVMVLFGVMALSSPAFLILKHPVVSTSPRLSGIRGTADPAESAGSKTHMAIALGVATIGMSAMFRPAVVVKTRLRAEKVRREPAIAYEDCGIALLDNGKFAQGLVGGEGAWGDYNFDPIGFSKFTEMVPYFREAELKHGRICMLAFIGLIVPDFIRVPGERYSFEAIPVVTDAHDALNSCIGVNFQILFWTGLVEFCCCKKVFEWNSVECAGDYNLGIPFFPKDEEGQSRMRLAELKNGRLAMVAFGGAITQAVITRHPFPWLY